MRDGHFDIVHSHLFRADIYAGLAVAQLGERRPLLVSTRHNDDRFFLNPFVGIVHYLVSARQDLIIAISDHIAHFTVARGVRHPARVRRVYHGVEPPVTRALEREGQRIRSELGIGPEAFLVGNVGRLALQKGQRHLIAAMPLLLERVPRAHAVIAGGRRPGGLPARPRRGDGCGRSGPRARTTQGRARPDARHRRLRHAVDLGRLRSGAARGHGRGAADRGFASRDDPEVVLDGQTGLLVPAGDPLALAEALAQLADQPALATRLGEAGRERVRRHFSLEKMVGDTELLYRELVDERSSGIGTPR